MLDHCWADIMVATIIDGDLQTFCFELTLTLKLEEANVHWPNVGSTLFSHANLTTHRQCWPNKGMLSRNITITHYLQLHISWQPGDFFPVELGPYRNVIISLKCFLL